MIILAAISLQWPKLRRPSISSCRTTARTRRNLRRMNGNGTNRVNRLTRPWKAQTEKLLDICEESWRRRDDEWYNDLEIESEDQDIRGGYTGTLQLTKEYEVHERQTCRISVQPVQLGEIEQIIDAGSKKRARTETTPAPSTSAQAIGDGLQATSEKRAKQI